MSFPTKYSVLKNQSYSSGDFSIIPIRYEDRIDIMKWRNEQMYHLRQTELLTEELQDKYFKTIVLSLFEDINPKQLLFSYLQNGKCIGYGGLVHILKEESSAEISFIMDTALEEMEFEKHWSFFLKLIVQVAFKELNLKKVFTYAYNLRPHLYPILEKNKFVLKSRLKNEIIIENKEIDVLIHERTNPYFLLNIRESSEQDLEMVYNWSNDSLVRSQSFNQDPIIFNDHKIWYKNKLKSKNSLLLINEYKNTPAGFIRFEIDQEKSVIGILIGKEYRGKGLAVDMLIKSCQFYFKTNDMPIWAYIKESNLASIKSFSSAGFIFSHKTVVNEIPSLIYKLQKK